nr:MAG TPA: hypothetical protein [Caudoviricetes sp.]
MRHNPSERKIFSSARNCENINITSQKKQHRSAEYKAASGRLFFCP